MRDKSQVLCFGWDNVFFLYVQNEFQKLDDIYLVFEMRSHFVVAFPPQRCDGTVGVHHYTWL